MPVTATAGQFAAGNMSVGFGPGSKSSTMISSSVVALSLSASYLYDQELLISDLLV